MAFQEVGEAIDWTTKKYNPQDKTQCQYKKGDVIFEEAILFNRKENSYAEGNRSRDDFIFRADGKLYGLNGAGHLRKKLDTEVKAYGTCIRLVYDGTEKIKEGKFKNKESHLFKVFVDAEKFDHEVAKLRGYADHLPYELDSRGNPIPGSRAPSRGSPAPTLSSNAAVPDTSDISL